jgi:WD40 repeat protein
MGGVKKGGGARLSPLALVAQPPSIPGVDSWSIETRGHRGPISVVAYSKDSTRLASGGDDGTVRLWDPKDGQLQRILLGHAGKITCLAWSPDGKTLASGSDDTTVRLWNADTGKLQHALAKHTGPIRALAWSDDGKTLASGSADRSVRLWDTATGESRRIFDVHKDEVVDVAWPSDKLLVSTSQRGEARTMWVWEAGSGKTVHSHEAKGHLAWTAERKVMVYKTADDTLAFWEVATNRKRSLTLKDHPGLIRGFGISLDGAMVATSGNNTVLWWDAATGTLLTAGEKQIRNVSAMVFSPDGKTLAVRAEQYVWLWKTDPVQKTGSANPFHKNVLELGGGTGWFPQAWSPDSKTVYVSTGDTVRFWDADSAKPLHTLATHSDRYAVAWAPDGKRLALSNFSRRRCDLWDAGTGTFIRRLDLPNFGGSVVDWARDGTLAASWDDRAIVTFDVSTGKPRQRFPGEVNNLQAVLWSPDSKKLATVRGFYFEKLIVFDVVGGNGIDLPPRGVPEQALAWSPDSKFLATGGPQVQVFDASTGKPLPQKFTGLKNRVHAVAWSPDGLTLASSDTLGNIVLWNARTGVKLKELQPHDGPVHALAWQADSKSLLSLGEKVGEKDGTLCFWQTDTDNPPRVVKGLPGKGRLSPDRRFLLSRFDPTRVQIWETSSGQLKGTFLRLHGEPEQYLAIAADGHYRISGEGWRHIVHVVQTKSGQQILSPEDFEKQYSWKNDPAKVRLISK